MITDHHCKEKKGRCQHRANETDIGICAGKHIERNAGRAIPKKIVGDTKAQLCRSWISQPSEKVVHGLV